ncbi:MAG: ABC transporter substrate-binding protein [Aggregatilineaceae bacterium]
MPDQTSHFRQRALLLAAVAVILAALLVVAYALSRDDKETDGLTQVTLFMSYIPSVQFAPVYVAAERGYFAEEGIEIAFENSFNEADGVERLANNDLQFGLISGEQVVLARAKGRPVVYVFEWYHRFPVGVVSPAELNITKPEDLKGRVVGIPGPQGASYMGLRALLNAAGMSEDDLGELRSIGFAAPENICENKVEAAVVYIVNEPLTIQQQCTEVNVIEVSDYATLVSNGLVTNEQTIRDKPELVRGMVRALQRGLADVIADPDAAFDISVTNYVKDLPEAQYETQRQVLRNSVALWRSDDLGRTNAEAWQTTQDILIQAGLLDAPLDDLSACYNMDFLPK